MWTVFLFPLIWILGVTFSMDVITIPSKGHHEEKIRMMYKSEADLLQTDAHFQKGYIYQIFVCNDPVSKAYISKRLTPIDSILMALFDTKR